MTKKHWWKYLLGFGALAIVGGVIAGGVVSCSNGNTTTPTTTSTPKKTTTDKPTTPTTTSDYKLVPQATKGVYYNENLETTNSSTSTTDISFTSMSSSNSVNYLPSSSLTSQQGLDVYVGGELAAVINPTETSNPTLTLNLANPNLTAQELSKAGSLLAVEPTLSNYQITYQDAVGTKSYSLPTNTPIEFGVMANTNENNALLEWGSGNNPLGAWFTVYCPNKDGNYLYGVANFPVQADGQLNFTTVNETIPFSYVDNGKTIKETLNVNVDLSPFYLGTATALKYGTLTSEIIDSNQLTYDKYLKADDYSKPLVLEMPTPTLTQYKVDPTFIIWNGVHYPISQTLVNFVDVPFTPTVKDGKITGWTAPGIYAYFANSNDTGVYQANYDLFNAYSLMGQTQN